jgi:serine/threonine protein kinase
MNKKKLKTMRVNGKLAYDLVVEELKVLKRLDHPNIIWLHEIIDDENSEFIYLVTNYHSRGSIEDLILKKNQINGEYFKVGL